jgi:dephospho-CoA kinase
MKPAPDKPRIWPPLLVIGLTGGIGSGKTTVSGMLRELGAEIIDADRVGREAVEPGRPALAEVIAAFGPKLLLPDGSLDRARLGAHVFTDARSRRVLNRIMFPRIRADLEERLRALQRRPPRAQIVVVEAAVLVEAGWTESVDRVVVIRAQQSTQVARLIAERGLTPAAAEARIRSQVPLSRRLRAADEVLDGEQTLAALREEVRRRWEFWTRLARGDQARLAR